MKWIAMCFALAGVVAQAATPTSALLESKYARPLGEPSAQTLCKPPRVLSSAGVCVCPPDTTATISGRCVRCPSPKYFDPHQRRCVCPPDTRPTESGHCVLVRTPETMDPATDDAGRARDSNR